PDAIDNMKTNELPFPNSYWYFPPFHCNERTLLPERRFTHQVKYPSQKIMVGCYAVEKPSEITGEGFWGRAAHGKDRNNYLFADCHSANKRRSDRRFDPQTSWAPWASLSW